MGRLAIRGTVATAVAMVGLGTVAGCSTTPAASPQHHQSTTTAPSHPTTTSAPSTTTAPSGSTSTAAAPTTTVALAAPCTEAAIAAGAGATYTVHGFGCTGSWAYADVSTNHGTASYTAVMVLSASGGAWAQATRAAACNTRAIAAALYTRACTTS